MDEDVKPACKGAGTIAYRLRVGVTGHRQLPDDPALAEQVGATLRRIRQIVPASAFTPIHLVVVSPLAEGADRLVAHAVLKDRSATLEVPLPIPRDDYLSDFATEESKREFDDLLARAQDIVVLSPSETREEAYQRVGRYVVGQCDVLIALWDGQRSRGQGGTAEVVARARERRVPLFWIQTEPPFLIQEELGDGIRGRAFDQLDDFNREPIDGAWLANQVARQAADLLAAAKHAGIGQDRLWPFCEWILPHYNRADFLARRYQSVFFHMGTALFLLAAASVITVPAQELFFPKWTQLEWLEVLLILAILFILFVGRRWRLHERWLPYRFLAEQFRAALFLALMDVRGSGERSAKVIEIEHPSKEWLRKAFDEVWSRRPKLESSEAITEELKQFLATGWIQDQIKYHQKASQKHHSRHRQLSYAPIIIFVMSLVVVFLYAFNKIGLIHVSIWNDGLSFLATALPAVAGALSGIAAQREYQRHSLRYRRMVRELELLKKRLESAPDLTHAHAVAQQVESLMMEELRDWFGVMQFHDIELPV